MTVTTAASLDEVVDRMQALGDAMHRAGDPRRHFHAAYLRTALAVRAALPTGRFLDPAWVETWAAVFARFYLEALEPPVPDVWVPALRPGPLGPRRRVLLGMHTHITHDLPLALLEVMGDEEFLDPALRHRRRRDHFAIDGVLVRRVGPELRRVGVRAVPAPAATARGLRDARADVWVNAETLAAARRQSPAAFAACCHELAQQTLRRAQPLATRGWPWVVAITRSGVRLDQIGTLTIPTEARP
jgi:hypothetical protein